MPYIRSVLSTGSMRSYRRSSNYGRYQQCGYPADGACPDKGIREEAIQRDVEACNEHKCLSQTTFGE